MEKENLSILELIPNPGFCVRENRIIKTNLEAKKLPLAEGEEITPHLCTGQEEYAAFTGGCLTLTLRVGNAVREATVTRMGDMDVFLVEAQTEPGELRALALAARELRGPLTAVMVGASRLTAGELRPEDREAAAGMERGLYQLLRLIGNMSDAANGVPVPRMEMRDVDALFREVLEKAGCLAQFAGVRITYAGLDHPVNTLADSQALERAALNMLSNALKFTPAGGEIRVSLSRRGRILCFSVSDSGPGIPENVLPELFRRYLRQPAIEDGRNGMGLGMVLIRAAAAAHGGTVLVDQPEDTGTRVTLTIAIRQGGEAMLRSDVLRVDYAGERDHTMIELSDVLPLSLYEIEN